MHYGSRLVFDREGYLFITLGERGEQERAQDLGTTQGKVVRIRPDGTIPPDNPVFPQPGAIPGIWSFGHRNPQGAALDPATGEVWVVGALAGEMLVRLDLQAGRVVAESRHLESLGERIRDVRQGPDGYPYLLTDNGRLLRVVAR